MHSCHSKWHLCAAFAFCFQKRSLGGGVLERESWKRSLGKRVLERESWKNVYMRYRIITFHVEKNRHSGLFINIHRRINRRYSVKMTSPGTNQLTIYYYVAGFSCVAPFVRILRKRDRSLFYTRCYYLGTHVEGFQIFLFHQRDTK